MAWPDTAAVALENTHSDTHTHARHVGRLAVPSPGPSWQALQARTQGDGTDSRMKLGTCVLPWGVPFAGPGAAVQVRGVPVALATQSPPEFPKCPHHHRFGFPAPSPGSPQTSHFRNQSPSFPRGFWRPPPCCWLKVPHNARPDPHSVAPEMSAARFVLQGQMEGQTREVTWPGWVRVCCLNAGMCF